MPYIRVYARVIHMADVLLFLGQQIVDFGPLHCIPLGLQVDELLSCGNSALNVDVNHID